MDLIKQAFDNLERTVERTVAEAASVVVESTSEFPKPAAEPARTAKQLQISYAAAANQAKTAQSSWDEFDWPEQQAHWQEALQELQAHSGQFPASQLHQQLVQLYVQLISLPDPLPALTNAAALASKSAELEAQCRSLQQEVHHLQQDQAEVSQLLADFNKEKEAHAALQAAHKLLQDEVAAAQTNTSSTAELEQKLDDQGATIRGLQASLASLRSEYEASQASLFELTAAQEAAAGSTTTAEQLAAEEVERLTAQLLQVRKERSLLQRQLQQYKDDQQQQISTQHAEASQQHTAIANVDDNGGIAQQQDGMKQHCDVHVAALQADLEAAQEAVRDQQHEVALLMTKLASAESRIQRLTAELSRRPVASAVAAMTEQIAALSTLLGQQLESEGWGQEAAAAAVLAAGVPGQLEQLLQERCKRLEQALQAAKADAAAAGETAAVADARLQDVLQQLQQSQQLVSQLEADVQLAMKYSGPEGFTSTAVPRVSANVDQLIGVPAKDTSDLARLVLTAAGGEGQSDCTLVSAASGMGAVAPESDSDAAALLAVVAGQRNRFRARITQLESEAADMTTQLQELTSQNNALKNDNIALIEKIRFLERYKQAATALPGSNGAAGQSVTVIRVDGAGCVIQGPEGYEQGSAAGPINKASRYRCGPVSLDLSAGKDSSSSSTTSAAVTIGGSRSLRTRGAKQQRVGCFGVLGGDGDAEEGSQDPETRYVKEYEAKLNPFAAFQASESEARLKGMQLHDKAMLAASRLIAGSTIARAGLAVYFVLLHVFLMVLIYRSATPHAMLEQVGTGRVGAAAAAQGLDAVAAARLAAAGGSVGGAGNGTADAVGGGLRLLLGMMQRQGPRQ